MLDKLDASKLIEELLHCCSMSSIRQSPKKFGGLSTAQLLIHSVNRRHDLHIKPYCKLISNKSQKLLAENLESASRGSCF